MKRAHRRLHLAMWLLILPAIALVLLLAFQARKPVPIEPRLGIDQIQFHHLA